jgi:aspartyl-tRNA(Asn)/glutamyl-tRNA(Gln) amidotransferase subunit B
LRSKEDAPDYRYFPEPDLPPIILSDDYILKVRAKMPTLPKVLKKQFVEAFDLSDYDASVLTEERATADYYLAVIKHTNNYKSVANWLINSVKSYLNDNNLSFGELVLKPKMIADLIVLIDDGKVNNLTAKQQLLPAMLENPTQLPLDLAKKLNLIQDSSDDLIEQILDDVIAKYPDKFEDLKKGKKKLMGLFMGEVMKEAKGKANPKMVTDLIMKKLKK